MKIHITGNAGSGKTTLARRLGQLTGVEPAGLDQVVWKENWKQAEPEERVAAEQKIAATDHWLVEGVSRVFRSEADLIIFLDIPLPVCLWRVIKRMIRFNFRSRPELPAGCSEIKVLWWVFPLMWKFHSNVRSVIYQDIASVNHEVLKNSSDVEAFLQRVAKGEINGMNHH